jgi:hypothetical protein
MERFEMRLRFARQRIAFRIRCRLTLMLDSLAQRCDPLSPVAFMLDEDAFSWEDDDDGSFGWRDNDDDWFVPGDPNFGYPQEEGGYDWYLGEDN